MDRFTFKMPNGIAYSAGFNSWKISVLIGQLFFIYFQSFPIQILQKKLFASASFELRSSELKPWPPPRPMQKFS